MPDSPDYQKYLPNSTRFSLQDMGELAARLGSVARFDRRGEVLFYDTFNYGLSGYSDLSSGVGSSIGLSTNSTFMSPYSLLLTTGAGVNATGYSRKILGVIDIDRAGLEVCYDQVNANTSLTLRLAYYYLGIRHLIVLELNVANNTVKILIDTGVLLTITTLNDKGVASSGHNFVKITWDISTQSYGLFILNGFQIDLSAHKFFTDVTALPNEFLMDIYSTNVAAGSAKYYLHHLILTSNEP